MGTAASMKVNQIGSSFDFGHNRSERALQAEALVPKLANPAVRALLLPRLDPGGGRPVEVAEAKAATSMHFVWVLRDAFTWERDQSREPRTWTALVERWAMVLDLPEWARCIDWWRHPAGAHRGDRDFVVHPCHRTIGWTKPGITSRMDAFGLHDPDEAALDVLIEARQVMNTESDCFMQTPDRLIIIECKDKTGFSTEQRARQQRLGACLARLLPRPNPPVFVDVAHRSTGINAWTWAELEALQP